jgi:hypothetical protein
VNVNAVVAAKHGLPLSATKKEVGLKASQLNIYPITKRAFQKRGP